MDTPVSFSTEIVDNGEEVVDHGKILWNLWEKSRDRQLARRPIPTVKKPKKTARKPKVSTRKILRLHPHGFLVQLGIHLRPM